MKKKLYYAVVLPDPTYALCRNVSRTNVQWLEALENNFFLQSLKDFKLDRLRNDVIIRKNGFDR